MERDFEQEFRELKQNEVPDLWNRIEAALPEKKAAAVLPEENKTMPVERYVLKKRMSWRNWGILIAACFCVLILIPVMFLRIADYSGDTGSDSSSMNSDSGAAQWEKADAASADAEASEGTSEAGMGEDVSESAESVAGAAEDGGTEDEGMRGQNAAEWEDGQILEGVIVEIEDVDLSGQEVFYEALVVQEDDGQLLDAGMEVRIFCDDESVYDFPHEPRQQALLKTGGRYTVTLCYQKAYGQESGEGLAETDGILTFLVVEASLEKER